MGNSGQEFTLAKLVEFLETMDEIDYGEFDFGKTLDTKKHRQVSPSLAFCSVRKEVCPTNLLDCHNQKDCSKLLWSDVSRVKSADAIGIRDACLLSCKTE